jgi:hypothetical protein
MTGHGPSFVIRIIEREKIKKLDSIFFLLLILVVVGGQMPYDVFGPRMCWRLRSGNERKTFQFHKCDDLLTTLRLPAGNYS